MNLKIHKASSDDMLELSRWIYMNNSVFQFNLPEIQNEFNDGRLVIATVFEGGYPEIVGFCSMTEDYTPHFFEVQQERRGQHIGESLFHKVMEMAVERGTTEMTMECSPRESYSFWTRQGFTLVGDFEGEQLMVTRKLPEKALVWDSEQKNEDANERTPAVSPSPIYKN